MAPLILDGRKLAAELRSLLQASVAEFTARRGTPPLLAVVHIEGNPSAEQYVRSLHRACDQVGMTFRYSPLPANCPQKVLERRLDALSADYSVDGLMIQMPLPRHYDTPEAVRNVGQHKDVDGVNPYNAGLLFQGHPYLVPNTPAGGMLLLQRYGIPLKGKHAVIVGRSPIVGQPMAGMLLNADATVSICHKATVDLPSMVRQGDIVVSAAGVRNLITGAMLKPGAVVIDFGINVTEAGNVVGDVDFASAAEVAGAITPVPGGTGPVTTMLLLQNVLRAAKIRSGLDL
jgi:methylenetetrahydrofolate dehydrogenase (NADP+) / methenyltetrahydrofolate cyclohydrolase